MVIEFRIQEIGQNIQSHTHSYGQFVVPFHNCVFIDIEDIRYVYDEKSIGYIPPARTHRYSSDIGVKSLIININPEMVKEKDRFTLENSGPFILDDRMKGIMDVIKEEIPYSGRTDSIKYLFFYIYDRLVETRTFKSISYIHEHYTEDIPMKKLSDLEHYSTNYFTDWFKKNIGMSPMAYIKRVRMEIAKQLILTTGYNLTQIAMQTGYSQSSTMCKVFRELEGCTPKEYRSRNS